MGQDEKQWVMTGTYRKCPWTDRTGMKNCFLDEPAVTRWQEEDDGLFGIGLFSLWKDMGSCSIEYPSSFDPTSHLTPYWSSYTIYHWIFPDNISVPYNLWYLRVTNGELKRMQTGAFSAHSLFETILVPLYYKWVCIKTTRHALHHL